MNTRARDSLPRPAPLGAEVPLVTAARVDSCAAGRSEQLVRVAVLVLVALLHVGLFALLYTVPWTYQKATARVEGEVLEIRFVTRSSRPPARASTSVARPVPPRPKVVLPQRAPVVAELREEPGEPRPLMWQQAPVVTGYVAGGRRFGADLRAAQARTPAARLPGSGQPVVAGLHMVDPRSQGVGGAVRMLAGLFGATDPHCVAVDSWRGLTTQEMLDRHISPDEVDRVAEEYHCRPR